MRNPIFPLTVLHSVGARREVQAGGVRRRDRRAAVEVARGRDQGSPGLNSAPVAVALH